MTPAELRVLILAPTGRDAPLAAAMLQRAGLAANVCQDAATLCEAMRVGVGVVLLAEEALSQATLTLLSATVAEQPAWSDVPIVIFGSASASALAHARAAQILHCLGNAVFVERPVRAITLVATINHALRARARQYAVQGTLEDLSRREADAQLSVKFLQQLLGIVSHDLRNPISAVVISAETLLRRKDLSEKQQRGVRRIIKASQRASTMVLDLLDFTRARLGHDMPLRTTVFEMGRLAQDLTDEIRDSHPGREIHLEVSGDTGGEWDNGRMAQVLQNLLSNALQYSAPDTTVRMRVHGEKAQAVTLAVQNAGAPIDAALQARMFEPMERGTDNTLRGTPSESRSIGLGLYIVKQIVEAHGGSIDVQSNDRAGTTFYVHLPRAPRTLVQAAAPVDIK